MLDFLNLNYSLLMHIPTIPFSTINDFIIYETWFGDDTTIAFLFDFPLILIPLELHLSFLLTFYINSMYGVFGGLDSTFSLCLLIHIHFGLEMYDWRSLPVISFCDPKRKNPLVLYSYYFYLLFLYTMISISWGQTYYIGAVSNYQIQSFDQGLIFYLFISLLFQYRCIFRNLSYYLQRFLLLGIVLLL